MWLGEGCGWVKGVAGPGVWLGGGAAARLDECRELDEGCAQLLRVEERREMSSGRYSHGQYTAQLRRGTSGAWRRLTAAPQAAAGVCAAEALLRGASGPRLTEVPCAATGPRAGRQAVAALSTGWCDVGIDVAALVHIDAGEDLVHELL